MENNSPNVTISIKDIIIKMYDKVLQDILEHNHQHYTFPGGRGSTKSSFIAIAIILLIINFKNANAVIFRKVGNTIEKSVKPQIEWAIYKLGLESMFDIPKKYNNPIIYKPTGQQIIFMGLDDPDKVKSIKLKTPEMYLAITWFEELDQYKGEAELRKVLQSTQRGGDKFWDFRSFNPPISINNWANEYTNQAEQRKDTLVVRNTYLDVPKEWLGQTFIDEAEILKEINYKAYQHEYLGIPVGTGGSVFDNVQDLDMEQEIDLGFTKVPMWKTFDNTYQALDWGFSIDPARFVKMYFDSNRLDLYIYAEYNTTHMSNRDLYEVLYNELKLVGRDELLIADSAELKSVSDFKTYGAYIRPAEKGPESIRRGIRFLQTLRHIYIDKRKCPFTYKEFIEYEYETDREGNFVSAFPDEDNHCLVGDTLVKTFNGNIPIKELVGKTGILYSYDIKNKKVVKAEFKNCRITFEKAEIYELELENGTIINCTGDHPILTYNRGYVQAKDLTIEDDIVFIDTV